MYSNDAALLRPWLEARLNARLDEHARFIGRLRDTGEVWGCVGYERFSRHDCLIHMAGYPGWMNRDMLKAAFAYPFRQLGLERVTGLVDATDEYVLNLDRKLGFVEEGRMRKALGDRDIIVMGMTRDDCKYWSE